MKLKLGRRRFILLSSIAAASGFAAPPSIAAPILVNYNVEPINQGNSNLCWAAATAMLLNWQLPGLYTMKAVAEAGGAEFVALYENSSEIKADQEARLYKKLNLRVRAGFSPTIDGWKKLLEAKGPLHVTIKTNSKGGMVHGVLLTGMAGDGTSPGTEVYYNDPADGSRQTKKISDFVKLYDGAANWTNNIIHNP